MASPICTVNGAATPALALTAGSTVTIALASSAGVNQWAVTAIATDDSNAVATINASLVVNNTTKTATFTAPPIGSAVTFQSQVNGGLSLQTGLADATQTVTFGCFVPASSGNNVLALGMTYEPSATNGWLSFFNAVARATSTGTTFANDLSGTATSQNVLGATAATKAFTYAATATSPGFAQASTTAATAQSITVSSQASTATNGTPGSIVLNIPAKGSTGSEGYVQYQRGAVLHGAIGPFPTNSSEDGIWLGLNGSAVAGTNFNFLSDGASTFFNAPSSAGNLYFQTAAANSLATFSVGSLVFYQPSTFNSAVAIAGQLQMTSATPTVIVPSGSGASATGVPLLFQGQNETGTTSTGGKLLLTPGQGTTKGGDAEVHLYTATAGTEPAFAVFRNLSGTDTKIFTVQHWPNGLANGNAIYMGAAAVSPSTTNFAILEYAGALQFNAQTGASMQFQIGNVSAMSINSASSIVLSAPVTGDGVSSPYGVHGDTTIAVGTGASVTITQYANAFFSISSTSAATLNGWPRAAAGQGYSKAFSNTASFPITISDGTHSTIVPANSNHLVWFTNAALALI